MLSWSSLYSAQYFFQTTGNKKHTIDRNKSCQNDYHESSGKYRPSWQSNHLSPVLRSCTLPTELLEFASKFLQQYCNESRWVSAIIHNPFIILEVMVQIDTRMHTPNYDCDNYVSLTASRVDKNAATNA